MIYAPLKLKNDKEKLPFPFPGQVCYQDFTESRFRTCDSRVFIRPVLWLQASMGPPTEGFFLPCIKDSCLLLYIKEGRAQAKDAGNLFDLTTGSGLLVSADHSLYLTPGEGPLSCLLLFLTGELLWELYRIPEEPVLCFTRYQYPDFEQRLRSLLDEYLTAEFPLLFEFSRHMDHLLSRIVHQSIRLKYDDAKQRRQSLMRVITYMREHCCEPLQVGEIAGAFGYSSSHFSRIFQQEFHQSPKKYLLRLRIARAEKLLAASDLSVEVIGQECGFRTTTHFIQTFREMYAMTPLQYRKQLGPRHSDFPEKDSRDR